MKTLMMGLLLVTGPGAALAGDASNTVSTISAQGDGSWEIICHVGLPGGDLATPILGPGRSSYSSRELRRASCDVKNGGKGPLVVTITAPAMACPFKAATADACQQTFAKGRAGSFELKAKSTR